MLVARPQQPQRATTARPSEVAEPANVPQDVLLEGHEQEVFVAQFSPRNGEVLATAGMDRRILLWRIGDFTAAPGPATALHGHQHAILGAAWAADGAQVYSGSVDASVCLWDAAEGVRVKKFRGHRSQVNSVAGVPGGGAPLVTSASNDGSVRVWDPRARRGVWTVDAGSPTMAVAFSRDGSRVFAGGLDNSVRAWDLRAEAALPDLLLQGHTDTITDLRLSPDGELLLSNAMDGTLRVWDLRAFVPAGVSRCLHVFSGAAHGHEGNLLRAAWSPDGSYVAAGGADRLVHVFSLEQDRPLVDLPGHKGCVNQVDFHPTLPLAASAGSDSAVILGRISLAEFLDGNMDE